MCEILQCYRHTERKAAKQHQCRACAGIIEAREKYEEHTGAMPGEGWHVYRLCLFCSAVYEEALYRHNFAMGEETIPFECLTEEFEDDGDIMAMVKEYGHLGVKGWWQKKQQDILAGRP